LVESRLRVALPLFKFMVEKLIMVLVLALVCMLLMKSFILTVL
jgi:hypothetical protein